MEEPLYVQICRNELFLFTFTLLFALLPRYTSRFSISTYVKCLTGGIILSIIILHIFPDIYGQKNLEAPLSAGTSFLILFAIDKLYIDIPAEEGKMEAEHLCDSLPEKSTRIQALIFVLALSVHSFFEGLSIPAKTGPELVWNLIGLLGHKWIEAFSLGLSIELSDFPKYIKVGLIIFYSFLTPFGSLVGNFITRMFNANNVNINEGESCFVKNILIGISSGAFLYIGFIEMLNSEFKSSDFLKFRLKKIFAVIVGFSIMSVILGYLFKSEFM